MQGLFNPLWYGPNYSNQWYNFQGPTNRAQNFQGFGEHTQAGGGPPANVRASSTPGPGMYHLGQAHESDGSGQGINPYSGLQPGLWPFSVPAHHGRPEPGDPLYTSIADGPELRLISQ
ncbi:hypothetical protein NL676_014933 [Syzygium grande]|nr:hypothetical protein NL676_014933 [Syzygium grande]